MTTATAACIGKAGLFEAVDIDSHHIAANICETCPALNWCRTRLAEEQVTISRRTGLTGTWAGELWNDGKRLKVKARRKRTENLALPAASGKCITCGVETAGTRHYCDPCRVLARAATQAKYEMAARRDRIANVGNGHACGKCGAGPNDACVSKNGTKASEMHYSRRAPLCECGVPARPASLFCETCRVEARREMHRQKSAQRYAAKTGREVAA